MKNITKFSILLLFPISMIASYDIKLPNSSAFLITQRYNLEKEYTNICENLEIVPLQETQKKLLSLQNQIKILASNNNAKQIDTALPALLFTCAMYSFIQYLLLNLQFDNKNHIVSFNPEKTYLTYSELNKDNICYFSMGIASSLGLILSNPGKNGIYHTAQYEQLKLLLDNVEILLFDVNLKLQA